MQVNKELIAKLSMSNRMTSNGGKAANNEKKMTRAGKRMWTNLRHCSGIRRRGWQKSWKASQYQRFGQDSNRPTSKIQFTIDTAIAIALREILHDQFRKGIKAQNIFKVYKSVDHHTFNWINQPDAATSQVYYLSFKYNSTCFGHSHAHH